MDGDFIQFLASERAFAILLTPERDGGGDPDKRWDTTRNAAFNEILGFYGLPYWYAWQVTILGLGPIWQSDNDAARRRAAELLEEGAIFAFGLSEQDHGADIYSTDMVLEPYGEGSFRQPAASTTSATETWQAWSPYSDGARTWKGQMRTSSSPRTALTPRTSCERTWSTARCT